MRTLIIPNAFLLYADDNEVSEAVAMARLCYQCRFIWMLKAGDAIILPSLPSDALLKHFFNVTSYNFNDIHWILWENPTTASHQTALKNPLLLEKLTALIQYPEEWQIQTCYYNQSIFSLSNYLGIKIDASFENFIIKDDAKKFNNKAFFRSLCEKYQLPVTHGIICHTLDEMKSAIKTLIKKTGRVIIKEAYNASGRGNTGVSLHKNEHLLGASVTHWADEFSIATLIDKNNMTEKSWIVEVYYPNAKPSTIAFFISSVNELPKFLYDAEIRMNNTWLGVEIPNATLLDFQREKIRAVGYQIGLLLQASGYQGHYCCDFIMTENSDVLLNEINVRPGAECAVHFIAETVLGKNYSDHACVITRRHLIVRDEMDFLKTLVSTGVQLMSGKSEGAFIFASEVTKNNYQNQDFSYEYFVAAQTKEKGRALEKIIFESAELEC